ncbi:IclR family transcriptional regulator [Modicisalibacter radicis]|uniref:IclR family transcriptional regulator n=1 Tax=Halomonas sp. EAR18 TaxID=2518972 RepID=UPI00109D426B|nr:helix-turn-helix domain-containing protein [Halomonas sp. EAR18]
MSNKSHRPPSGVLERGLSLLACFTQERPRLHLRELAELTGLDKTTSSRALKTLVDWGYLERSSDGSYSPGPANLRMASIFRTTSNFVSRVEAPIISISRQVGQTTSFFVRSGSERVCLARDHAHQDFRYFIEVGASVPLDKGGAAAQIILAYSDVDSDESVAIRKRGYYISRGERHRHFASIATPLFESDGQFLGAITITGMALDLSDEDLKAFLDIIQKEVAAAGFTIV